MSTVWDTADAYFDARPQVLGDPEVRALMQARGMAPVQTAFTEVYGQSGNPEGKYAVSVVAAVASPSPDAWQSEVQAASNVMLAHGVSGMRFTRAIAAGQQSGVHIALGFTDSLDSYLAASAAAATDGDFVAAMTDAEGQIVMRQFNRMIWTKRPTAAQVIRGELDHLQWSCPSDRHRACTPTRLGGHRTVSSQHGVGRTR